MSTSTTSQHSPCRDLLDIIEHYQPGSLVYCGTTAEQALADCQQSPQETLALSEREPLQDLPLPRLYDLGLISDTLEYLNRTDGQLLLGQLRNMGATRLAVLVRTDSDWSFRDFIGLGFTRLHSYGEPATHSLYAYDLDTYNHKRTWNNPEYWANPEMWDKARW